MDKKFLLSKLREDEIDPELIKELELEIQSLNSKISGWREQFKRVFTQQLEKWLKDMGSESTL